jgi:hypothetical protein
LHARVDFSKLGRLLEDVDIQALAREGRRACLEILAFATLSQYFV